MHVTVPWSLEPPTQLTSLSEVEAWVDTELTFWRKLQPGLTAGNLQQVFSWSSIETSFQQLRAAAVSGGSEVDVQTAANSLVTYVTFSSRHELAAFIASLITSGEDMPTIGLVFAFFKQPDVVRQVINYPELFAPALKAAYYHVSFRQKQHQQAFPAFMERFSAYERETIGALRKTQDELRAAEEQRADWATRAEATVERQANQFSSDLAAFRRDLSELKEEYSERFALRAPMEYWSKKADDHERSATIYRNWFIGLLGAGVVALTALAVLWLLPELHKTPTVLWPVVLFSALVAIWAWPIRLASKFYLSQRHLFEDSRERQIIAQTFLALREKVDMKDEDRKLLLAALFRDTTAGLVKDDHSVNLVDALATFIQRK